MCQPTPVLLKLGHLGCFNFCHRDHAFIEVALRTQANLGLHFIADKGLSKPIIRHYIAYILGFPRVFGIKMLIR
ncbi:hypothetical protein D3C84_1123220 [compost metagenome]